MAKLTWKEMARRFKQAPKENYKWLFICGASILALLIYWIISITQLF